MSGPLDGKVAWVTGAGTGIGRAIALSLARAGASVALTGRTAATLQETAVAVMTANGQAIVVPADVTSADQVRSAHDRIVAELGAPHILVNNAGFNLPRRHWRELNAAGAQALVDVNLSGTILCTLSVLPAMRASGGGLLVHIASSAGNGIFLVAGPIYTAAKHGVVALSATLNAEEGIHGIRSVCISPGEVETPILDRRPQPPSAADRALILQPQDIADAVLFAASLPPRACVAEMLILPTNNPTYRRDATAIAAKS